ncbi:hypothetical protein SIN8267_00180 [Sinobacterium norvegicum]|uniref:HTH tetR-type domain-containing protein n=1 Tax=Sinobacterium norvegicum TaxID=1641715 RepID=A0ABM9AA30_9GAMM|nr:TetR/AcrR family transcriptional regulator [Sinobacterium norvegicum]CAH0990097.1 hypothetical protein SIN8267_00180 [Sinobacterium norvegicum]
MLDNHYVSSSSRTSYSSLVSQALQQSSHRQRLSPTKMRRRQALLNAAFELANTGTLHELNIQAIVKRAKTTRTTAYNYFENSDALISELLLQWFSQCLEEAAKQLDSLSHFGGLENNNSQNIAILLAKMYQHPKMIALLLHGLSSCSQYRATQQYHQALTIFLTVNQQPEQAKLLFHGALVALASGADFATTISTLDQNSLSTHTPKDIANATIPIH